MTYIRIAWRFLSGYLKYWKPILAALILGWCVVATFMYMNKRQELSALSTSYEQAQGQLKSQSDSIKKLTSLQDKFNEQLLYREKAKELFWEESLGIQEKLDGLKKANPQYNLCSKSELPYSIDSMFNNSNEGSN